MFVGIGIGINRTRFAGGFADSYSSRVIANGGVIEALPCVDAASSLLRSASLLLIPSGFKAGVAYAQLPADANGDLTWSRASSATRTLASGTIETPRTNHIRNSSMVGASTSPSTLPTNWVSQSTAGLTLQVASVGTEDGLNYIDVRYSGTATSTTIRLFLEAGNQIVAADGQIWTTSFYTSISGSALPSNYRLGVATNTSAGFSVSSIVATPNIPQTTTLTRYNRVVTLPGGATVARAQPGIYLTLVSGQTYDFTIRIAAPQFELGLQVTDWIPTTNSARTTFAGITQDGLSASNIPRLSYLYGSCPALLLEPQRTNSLRNSTMQGASTSPSTLPTNWAIAGGGLTGTVVGVGTENGLPYIDVQLIGTATGNVGNMVFESTSQIVASNGQAWTNSFWAKTISTTALPTNFRLTTIERTIAGSYITQTDTTFTPSSTLTRFPQTVTLAGGATVARVQPGVIWTIVNGQSYNFTIRIAAPQMELGAFATTWIDTTNAAATRLVDTFTRNNIYTNGLISASGGTWYVELRNNVVYVRDVGVSGLFIGDTNGGASNSLAIRTAGGSTRLIVSKYIGGVPTTLYTTTTDTVKLALKWNGTGVDIFANGTKVVSASSFTTTLMEFLAHSTSGDVPKFIQAMALSPTPLSDGQCQTLTT